MTPPPTPAHEAAIRARQARYDDEDGRCVIADRKGVGWAMKEARSARRDLVAHAADDLRALLAALDEARADLLEYGRHSEGCSAAFAHDPPYRCRCGWSAIETRMGGAM